MPHGKPKRPRRIFYEERAELDEYEHITCLLELMQSKARLSLKHAGFSP